MPIIAFICLLVSAVSLYILYPELRPLTLISAWYWAVAAWCCLAGLIVVETAAEGSIGLRSSLSYFCATMLLAPLVAVLGARRPSAAAWPWFVVLPMIVVLQWPSLTQLIASHGREPVEMGTPALVGVLAVLLMGCGNYFGTGNTLAAGLMAAAVGLLLVPVLGTTPQWPHGPLLATIPLAVASVLSAGRFLATRTMTPESEQQAADRLWILFRDSFGTVWARRVMDRVNQFADREQWPARLTLDGFVWSPPAGNGRALSVDPAGSVESGGSLRRPLEILCWILQRFCELQWLQQQLGRWHPGTTSEP